MKSQKSAFIYWEGPISAGIAAALGLLAIAFQIQLTPNIGANPIRISAADLLLPVLSIPLLIGFASGRSETIRWRLSKFWLWLIVLSIVMSVALGLGRVYTGDWISWALFNKFIGWFILLAYLMLGGWCVTNCRNLLLLKFVRFFLVFCWFVAAYSLADYMLWLITDFDLPAGHDTTRLYGFIENPNAFGLMIAVALGIQLPDLAHNRYFSKGIHIFAATILLVALVFTASRSAWLGFALALAAIYLLGHLDTRRFAVTVSIAAMLVALLLFVVPILGQAVGIKPEHGEAQVYTMNQRILQFEDEGASLRYQTNLQALDMWRERPLFGIGLGGFLWPQLAENVEHPVIIHSTYLWLLTETGLVGFLLFAGFFVVCIRALLSALKNEDPATQTFLVGVLGVIAVFAGASIGTEAMYQRHIWFLVGCALALPAVARPPDSAARSQATGLPSETG